MIKMKKYIHYCWFGGKPLPKLAKKCMKSWKKYLPNFEIMRWDETNVDVNECPFIKEAYENKKWAFVADYARAKAMYEYGGIYFDTDMEIIKPIEELLANSFIGVEDSGKIACGVWMEKEPSSYLSKYLLSYYQSQKSFDVNNMFEFSIPKLITDALSCFGFDEFNDKIQVLDNKMTIFPREYFYPYSYDRQNNVFNENTCMIHYYDATWVPKGEQRTVKMIRKYGRKKAQKIINFKAKVKKILKSSIKLACYPFYKYFQNKKSKEFFEKRIVDFRKTVTSFKNKKELAICNSEWLGTKYATQEIIENVYPFHELYEGDNIKEYAQIIKDSKIRIIIFSSFCIGWDELIEEIRKIDDKIIIKVLWHGSNAMHCEDYDWAMFYTMFRLLNQKKINSIGFVKKSMYDFYKAKGYNVEFVMNYLTIPDVQKQKQKKKNKNIKIGLYASGNRWVKNFYNQFAAASLIKNAEIDCIPLSQRIREYATILKANVKGVSKPMKRDELLARIAQNDINVYCTFVECAPLLPLESMELGVPCITGNNHHYWEGTPLEKYLIVDKVDNSYEIYKRILYCLNNKEKIIELYETWKKDYIKEAKKSVAEFLKY